MKTGGIVVVGEHGGLSLLLLRVGNRERRRERAGERTKVTGDCMSTLLKMERDELRALLNAVRNN